MMCLLSTVVANQRLAEENKKLGERISKLTNDPSEEVERQMVEYNVAVEQAKTRVAMMATSESRKFYAATNGEFYSHRET